MSFFFLRGTTIISMISLFEYLTLVSGIFFYHSFWILTRYLMTEQVNKPKNQTKCQLSILDTKDALSQSTGSVFGSLPTLLSRSGTRQTWRIHIKYNFLMSIISKSIVSISHIPKATMSWQLSPMKKPWPCEITYKNIPITCPHCWLQIINLGKRERQREKGRFADTRRWGIFLERKCWICVPLLDSLQFLMILTHFRW